VNELLREHLSERDRRFEINLSMKDSTDSFARSWPLRGEASLRILQINSQTDALIPKHMHGRWA
jgi:hypothetical protein